MHELGCTFIAYEFRRLQCVCLARLGHGRSTYCCFNAQTKALQARAQRRVDRIRRCQRRVWVSHQRHVCRSEGAIHCILHFTSYDMLSERWNLLLCVCVDSVCLFVIIEVCGNIRVARRSKRQKINFRSDTRASLSLSLCLSPLPFACTGILY